MVFRVFHLRGLGGGNATRNAMFFVACLQDSHTTTVERTSGGPSLVEVCQAWMASLKPGVLSNRNRYEYYIPGSF